MSTPEPTILMYDIPRCIAARSQGKGITELAGEIGIAPDSLAAAMDERIAPPPELLAWLGLRELGIEGFEFYEEVENGRKL